MIKKIEKKLCFPCGVNAQIDVGIPLQEDYCEKAINSDFVDEILINQFKRGIENVTTKYIQSPLPNIFLEGQNVVVTNDLPFDVYGLYNKQTDLIYLEPDHISFPIGNISPEFIFGYEMGHKIQKYRNVGEAYSIIAHFFGISIDNQSLIEMVYSDIVGNIAKYGYHSPNDDILFAIGEDDITDENIYHLDTIVTPKESEFIKRRVLHSIYHV